MQGVLDYRFGRDAIVSLAPATRKNLQQALLPEILIFNIINFMLGYNQ